MNTKSILILTLITQLLASALLAEYRTFRSTDGTEIEAELTGYKDGQVELVRKDMRRFNADIKLFSKADQDYIKEWAKTQALADVRLEFDIDYKKTRPEKTGDGLIEIKEFEAYYRIKVTNKSINELKNITIKYQTFKFEAEIASEGEGTFKRKSGTKEVVSFPVYKEIEITTDRFEMTETELENGVVWMGGGDRESEDELAGAWVRVYAGDKLLAEHSKPNSLKTRTSWEEKK